MEFDYFYGQQADLFSFFRIPKVLFTNERFWNVSTDAKLLYGILLDRMNLSAKNGWCDEDGRVYIIFTVEEIMESLGCANKKSGKLLDELEKKCGLIERKRQGLGKPNLIYVKNFVSAVVDNSVERHFKKCQKHTVIILILLILILMILIMNDMGKFNGSEPNRSLKSENGEVYDIIAGDFLVAGLTEDDFGSLSPELMKKFEEKFHQPEMFIQMSKGIMAIPLPDDKVKKSDALTKTDHVPHKSSPDRDSL